MNVRMFISLLFNIILEALRNPIMQEKIKKKGRDGKEDIKSYYA